MAALAPTDRTDLNRAARIIAAISVAGPLIAELLHPWIIRFPAIGAVVAVVEILWTAYTRSSTAPPGSIPAPMRPPDDTYLS